jgi:hypothetical protein
LGNLSGEGQRLHESELRGSKTKRPQSCLVVLGQRSRGPTEAGAHTRKTDRGRLSHASIDAYTSIEIQENRRVPLVKDEAPILRVFWEGWGETIFKRTSPAAYPFHFP